MDFTQILGFSGATLAGLAYFPQITHLIKEKCSAGISSSAFLIWLISSTLMLTHALTIKDFVFILLGIIQIIATLLILFYGSKYKSNRCSAHNSL